MKKIYSLLAVMFLVLALPVVLAIDVGSPITPIIDTEDFLPRVWMCDSRVVLDDHVEPGRHNGTTFSQPVSSYNFSGENLHERINNYAFEGEQIVWDVLVMDKNGIEKIVDVFGTIGTDRGPGNDIEVNCILDKVLADTDTLPTSCNARILEEEFTNFPDNTAALYKCVFTVETPLSMDGEYWITVEAEDLDGFLGSIDEHEYWYLNPVIALTIDGDILFSDVRPGSASYSTTILVGNDDSANPGGSGVLLDMFISGTDFYDSTSSGAKCPLTNQLLLGDGDSQCDVGPFFGAIGPAGHVTTTDPFCYFATQGAYSTQTDARSDAEGYVGINYADKFGVNPAGGNFYGAFNGDGTGYEIMQQPLAAPLLGAPYFNGNVLSPGSEMAITFRLNLPEPCNGDFDSGDFYFWGEAI